MLSIFELKRLIPIHDLILKSKLLSCSSVFTIMVTFASGTIIHASENSGTNSDNKINNQAILVMLGGSRFGLSMADKIIKIAEHFDEQFIIFRLNCFHQIYKQRIHRNSEVKK